MADDEFHLETKDFDYVVFGTGLTECLVSASLARIGKSVLHLDENKHYGGSAASLPLDSLHEILTNASNSRGPTTPATDFAWSESTPINGKVYEGYQSLVNVTIPERAEGVEDMLSNASACRRCSIDLVPKTIWSRSLVIDTLIRAGASRYLEFKSMQHLYLQTAAEMVQVPVSKADVFKTSDISLIEKRQLMKFITTITQPDDTEKELLAKLADSPFVEYTKAKKLTERLTTFLLYAVALEPHHLSSPTALTTSKGVAAIIKFMSSVGRYGGNSPWIYPLFGLADLCQSFSRLSAVYGAVFILGFHPTELTTERDESSGALRISGLSIGNTKGLKAKHVISSMDHLPELAQPYEASSSKTMSRCVVISDQPLKGKESAKENIVSVIPPQVFGNPSSIIIIQLDESASVVPAGKYLWQIWTEGTEKGPESDLKAAADHLISAASATVFYSAYWSHVERTLRTDIATPSNLIVVDSVDCGIGADCYFEQAERIFQQLCPGEEFIPMVPNPEDIIWGGDEEGEGEGDNSAVVAEAPAPAPAPVQYESEFERAMAETPDFDPSKSAETELE